MAPRLELQSLLVDILDSDSVYFQPPENTKITYPCIIYNREDILATWADNKPHTLSKGYLVTVIDRDPDSEIPDKIATLPMCIHDRFFVADNLNHTVFKLFF